MTAVERWGAALRSWAIPEEILAAAPESPFGFPVECFRHRVDAVAAAPTSPSVLRALEALGSGGTVLDVGAGAGAASLPLAPPASLITAVDPSAELLEAFLHAAGTIGVGARAVRGAWPDVASQVEPTDVVVCSNVLYNVADIEPFLRALAERTRRRAVIEITDRHPLAWMNDLWLHFHGLVRPGEPSADDAVAVLAEMGIPLDRQDHFESGGRGSFRRREDAVALVRRRLCLPATRDDEIVAVLGERLAERDGLWSAGPPGHDLVTLWWDA